MKEIVIKTNNLSKTYKNIKAVDGVNINIGKGDIYGLVGENGSGKTTIIKMLLGLVGPSSGSIEIFSKTSLDDLNKVRDKIGYVLDSPALYPHMTGEENLQYLSIMRGIDKKKEIKEALDLVGLESLGRKKVKSYSLGMKQRLSLASMLILDSEILILDEPINGLDPQGIVELRKILLRLNREKGISILISSHILGELSQIASRYGFLEKGKLIEELSSEDLSKKCRKYLSIRVSDIESATVVLEKDLVTLDYKVTNDGEIQLFDYLNEPEKVSQAFSNKGIYIKTMKEEGMDLEGYYINLLGGNRNA